MKNVLLKAHKIAVRYALFYAPVYAALSAYFFARYGDALPEGGLFDVANNLGFAWILSLGYVFLALLFYRRFRETLLARLAGFKEGDERSPSKIEVQVGNFLSQALFVAAVVVMLLP